VTLAAPPVLPVRVDPALAETVVRRVVAAGRASDPTITAAHAERVEPLYAIGDERERMAAFEALALAEFEELGLAGHIRMAVEARPAVASVVRMVLLGGANGRHDEGVTWEPTGAHLGLRVEPARFDRPDRLAAWADHVLGHAEDTLDPSFGFQPGLAESALGGPAQARFHDLWDVSVDGRTSTSGRVAAGASRQEHRARIAAHLPEAPDRVIDTLVDRLWAGPRPTYPELVGWAADLNALARTVSPRGIAGAATQPDRCPLCRFPGGDVRVADARLSALVAADYPDWQPTLGLCGRCADRYRFSDRMEGNP